jgi:hypothetical protein
VAGSSAGERNFIQRAVLSRDCRVSVVPARMQRCAMVVVAVVAWGWVSAGCLRSSRGPNPGSPTIAAAPTSADAGPVQLAVSRCVLHAGESGKKTRRIKGPGGVPQPATVTDRCSMNAECIESKGKVTPGDGFVAVDCEASACTCTVEVLGPTPSTSSSRFEIAAPCTSPEQAGVLLRERCLGKK